MIDCQLGCGKQLVDVLLHSQTDTCSLFVYQFVPQKKKKKQVPVRKIVCQLGCAKQIVAALEAEHYERECPLREVPCKMCGECVHARDLIVHNQKECPERNFTCECGEALSLSRKVRLCTFARACECDCSWL